MTHRVTAGAIVFMLTLTAGCSVTGKWSMASVEPEAARRDFEFASLSLQKDGTFYAESQVTVVSQTEVKSPGGDSFYSETKEGGIRTASGTYTFEDGTLTLAPHGGPPVPYDAVLVDANRLRLEKFWQGRKVKAVFKRVE